ncbi:MAG: TlpA disulfide reductase family protein [Pyrinomonadaceae bacterium]
MAFAQQARPPQTNKVWTSSRIALAAIVFVLLAMALSSSCNPTDVTSTNTSVPTNTTTAPAKSAPPVAPAKAAPVALPAEIKEATNTTLDGKTFKLKDYEGKVLVLNLWATWCGPCRKEIPEFIAMHRDYQGRGVEFVGLTIEDDRGNTPEAVKEFTEQFKINYPVAWADQNLWATLLSPNYGIPQTYVLTKDGRVLKKFVGYSPQVGGMVRAAVEQALSD